MTKEYIMSNAPEWEYPKKIYVLPENAKSFGEKISAPRKCYILEDYLTSSAPVSVQEAAIIVANAIDADMVTASRIASEVGKTLENETPVSHWLSTILRALAEQE